MTYAEANLAFPIRYSTFPNCAGIGMLILRAIPGPCHPVKLKAYSDLVKPAVLRQPVYIPGRPIELVAHELDLDSRDVIKLASNENPLGPSPKAVEAVQGALPEAHLYPENECYFLKQRIAAARALQPDQLVVGAGSNEIIYLLGHAFIDRHTEVIVGQNAFIAYKLATLLFGGALVEVPLRDYTHDLQAILAAVTKRTRLIFLPSPNNPTGTANEEGEILRLVSDLPEHVILCVDEAYAEYLDHAPDLRPAIEGGRKVICLRTFSKIYGLASLRIGYGYADPELAGFLNRVRPPFNVSSAAQAAALAALDDTGFVRKSRRLNREGLRQLGRGFTDLGLSYVPSCGNFLLVQFENCSKVFLDLQARGIIVRPLTGYQLPNHLRISVGTAKQNASLLAALAEVAHS